MLTADGQRGKCFYKIKNNLKKEINQVKPGWKFNETDKKIIAELREFLPERER